MKAIRTLMTITAILCMGVAQGQTNWTSISQPGTNLLIVNETTSYAFINEGASNHGYKYTLKKSTDGFHSFVTIKTKTGDMGCYSLEKIFFINSQIGFIGEVCQGISRIYKTTDGGENWTETGFGGSFELSMYFLREDLGYYSFFPGGTNDSYFAKNETVVYTTKKYKFENNQIKFINDSTGFIFCTDSINNAVILKTTSSGQKWNEVSSMSDNLFKDIHFISDSVGFVVGTNGHILKSNNMGESWHTIQSTTNYTLNSIDFFNGNIGCIVGDNGLVLKSVDSGLSWTQEDFINTNNLIYVRLFDNGLTYINDAEGYLYSKNSGLGIDKNCLNDIRVYPNPSDGIVNISIPQNIQYFDIGLYNMEGRRMLTTSQHRFSIDEFPQGIYILEIVTKQGIFRDKVIKQ